MLSDGPAAAGPIQTLMQSQCVEHETCFASQAERVRIVGGLWRIHSRCECSKIDQVAIVLHNASHTIRNRNQKGTGSIERFIH